MLDKNFPTTYNDLKVQSSVISILVLKGIGVLLIRDIAFHRKAISELRSVAYHIGPHSLYNLGVGVGDIPSLQSVTHLRRNHLIATTRN